MATKPESTTYARITKEGFLEIRVPLLATPRLSKKGFSDILAEGNGVEVAGLTRKARLSYMVYAKVAKG